MAEPLVFEHVCLQGMRHAGARPDVLRWDHDVKDVLEHGSCQQQQELLAPERSDLSQDIEEAIVSMLSLAARGEVLVEQRRVKLFQVGGALRADDLFKQIVEMTSQSSEMPSEYWPDRVRWCGLCRWLGAEDGGRPLVTSIGELKRVFHRGLGLSSENDVEGPAGLNYLDFVEVVVPKHPLHLDLRWSALAKSDDSCRGQSLPAEILRCFKQLVQEELEFFRRQRSARIELAAAFLPTLQDPAREVLKLLRDGGSGRATFESVTALVTERLGVLPLDEASALFHRLDAGRTGEISLIGVSFVVDLTEDEDAEIAARYNLRRQEKAKQKPSNVFEACVGDQNLEIVLAFLMRMYSLNLTVEEAKSKFRSSVAASVSAEGAAFKLFNHGRKAYVTHSDIYFTLDRLGRKVPLDTISALVRETSTGTVSRRLPDVPNSPIDERPSSLSLFVRDVCCLLAPKSSARDMTVSAAALLIQKADAAAKSLQPAEELLSAQAVHALLDFVELAADAILEAQQLQKQLGVAPEGGESPKDAVTKIFRRVCSDGADHTGQCQNHGPLLLSQDFRSLVRHHGVWSDEDCDLMWFQLAGSGAISEIPLSELLSVLSPLQ
eukprot:TRINITY_DN4624_c0_g4_i1.p1 TRINITY_DN4624_c0_g4~~TRINITY_DN4624_c0_g4_i1.p1  ORF type:complete len:607 (+),score=117.59 TRINITY_DN4624_c0_g4_i1:95-1915(+)